MRLNIDPAIIGLLLMWGIVLLTAFSRELGILAMIVLTLIVLEQRGGI